MLLSLITYLFLFGILVYVLIFSLLLSVFSSIITVKSSRLRKNTFLFLCLSRMLRILIESLPKGTSLCSVKSLLWVQWSKYVLRSFFPEHVHCFPIPSKPFPSSIRASILIGIRVNIIPLWYFFSLFGIRIIIPTIGSFDILYFRMTSFST